MGKAWQETSASGAGKRRNLVFALVILLCWANPQAGAQATWSSIVTVGPGYVDSYTRQVVRTSADAVYVITNASGYDGGTALSSVRVYKGSPEGNPTSFAEMDAGHRPGNSVRVGGVEAKLAGADRYIQIVYEDIGASQAKYILFDTVTDTWGVAEVVGTLNGQNRLNRYYGKTGLALDSNGVAHVITGGTNQGMYYVNRVGGTWSAPVTVAGSNAAMHPSMAFDRKGVLHVAYYDPVATMSYRQRHPATGAWSAVETVTTTASTSESDESPSLVIDSSGRALITYLAGDFTFHFQLARRDAANTWTDISPPAQVAGHSPGLNIDANGNLFAIEGHDLTTIQPSVAVRSALGTWGPYQILASGPPSRDGSSSSRWDLLWPGNTSHLDTTCMDENGKDAFGNFYATTYYLHAALGSPAARTLTVVSTNPGSGVAITVIPADNNGQGNGSTPFTRSYSGTTVTLTAPMIASGKNFSSWTGCDSVSGSICTVTLNADHTVTANFATPKRRRGQVTSY